MLEQFNIADERDVPQIESVLKQDLLPSFALHAIARTNREKVYDTGKTGDIHNLCRPNAILTFKEYLEDYANAKIKKLGQKIIEKYLNMIEKED